MTIYEVMKHNWQHGVVEKGVATLLHPIYENGQYDSPAAMALQFYKTDVVVAYPDGTVKLDSGGYNIPRIYNGRRPVPSNTTKERISRYLPSGCGIYQQKNKWYVATPSGEFDFVDGMYIRPDGETSQNVRTSPASGDWCEFTVGNQVFSQN